MFFWSWGARSQEFSYIFSYYILTRYKDINSSALDLLLRILSSLISEWDQQRDTNCVVQFRFINWQLRSSLTTWASNLNAIYFINWERTLESHNCNGNIGLNKLTFALAASCTFPWYSWSSGTGTSFWQRLLLLLLLLQVSLNMLHTNWSICSLNYYTSISQ